MGNQKTQTIESFNPELDRLRAIGRSRLKRKLLRMLLFWAVLLGMSFIVPSDISKYFGTLFFFVVLGSMIFDTAQSQHSAKNEDENQASSPSPAE